MKTSIKSVALFVAFSLAAAGCQKETIVDNNVVTGEVSSMQTVTYMINGEISSLVIQNDEEWMAFLNWMVALAEEGKQVRFFRGNVEERGLKKEVVTYTTKSHDDAVAWANEMSNAGYEVSIDFDEKTGVYTCIAMR